MQTVFNQLWDTCIERWRSSKTTLCFVYYAVLRVSDVLRIGKWTIETTQSFKACRCLQTTLNCAVNRLKLITILDAPTSILVRISTSYKCWTNTFNAAGLVHIAVPRYERVLQRAQQASSAPFRGFDMIRETAFNLAMIYNQSGSPDLARQLYRTWLAV